LRDGVALPGLLDISCDTARLARLPVWSVFAAMVAHGLLRKRVSAFNPVFAKASLATTRALSVAQSEWLQHPWAGAIARASPARAMRMLHAADLSYYFQPSSLTQAFTTAPVPASLPVVETALPVAPYVMTLNGADRGLVRMAFADLLPAEVRARPLKGDTTRFHACVLERQLPFIRSLLLDGELVRRGLVRKDKLAAALAPAHVIDGAVKGAVMSAFLAEAWLQRLNVAVQRRSASAHAA
jgi:hypothetical protein